MPPTHQAHYLTRTPTGSSTLHYDGITYTVTKLKPNERGEVTPAKTKAQKLQQLPPCRRKMIRLAEKLRFLTEEQVYRKVEARLVELKRAKLRLDLGVGALRPKHKEMLKVTSQGVHEEHLKLMDALAEWEQTL